MCPNCTDIVALASWKKSCKCGKVYGQYTDRLKAKVSPEAILLAFDSSRAWYIDGRLLREMVYEAHLSSHDGQDITIEEF